MSELWMTVEGQESYVRAWLERNFVDEDVVSETPAGMWVPVRISGNAIPEIWKAPTKPKGDRDPEWVQGVFYAFTPKDAYPTLPGKSRETLPDGTVSLLAMNLPIDEPPGTHYVYTRELLQCWSSPLGPERTEVRFRVDDPSPPAPNSIDWALDVACEAMLEYELVESLGAAEVPELSRLRKLLRGAKGEILDELARQLAVVIGAMMRRWPGSRVIEARDNGDLPESLTRYAGMAMLAYAVDDAGDAKNIRLMDRDRHGRGGRPAYPENKWAWQQVNEMSRPRCEVELEWLDRMSPERRGSLTDPHDSFNKAVDPRKKWEETE